MDSIQDSFPSLFWGYAAIWLILGVYIFSLGARVSRLEREIKKNPEK